MKGVIVAGGLGTRLYPLTHATNKHLLPIYNQPMVFYPIQTLVRAGITDILIITGGPHAGHFLRVLKNGKDLGIKHLEFVFQEGEGGIAAALSLAEDFSEGKSITVILGDNTTDANISAAVKQFENGAMIFLKKVPEPQHYGVAVFSKDKIISIVEKPKNPKSQFAVTGLYIYDNQVFKIIKKIKPSKRGELEITDVNNHYLRQGELQWKLLNGFWTDAGKFESLHLASSYWAKKRRLKL